MKNKDTEQKIKVIENVLRTFHLTGSVDFRAMAIAILASLSINKRNHEKNNSDC